jgi:hypothetical protein
VGKYLLILGLFSDSFTTTGYTAAKSISVAVRSKAYFRGYSIVGIAGSNPAGAWMFVRCVCCVARSLCDELVARSE